MSNIAIRSASALTVMGLSLSVALVGAPVAIATDDTQTFESPATIQYGEKGSLNIHKRAIEPGTEGDKNATGNASDEVKGATLRNIPFKLELIHPITGKKGNTWQDAYNESKKPIADLTGTEVQPGGKTGTDGTLRYEGLDLGLYKVTEQDDENAATTAAAPFLVFLPMTNPENNSAWNYDVHVYPKNQYDPSKNDDKDSENPQFSKTVSDEDKSIGDQITYTIKSAIPDVTVNDVTWYQISDQLEADILEIADEDVKVSLDDEQLVAGTHYALLNDNGKIVVSFKEDGLAKLTEARKAVGGEKARVVTTIDAKVVAVGDGHAANTAELKHNDPRVNSKFPEPQIDPHDPGQTPLDEPKKSNDGAPVNSYWANIKIEKRGESADGVLLGGAEFELYRCESKTELVGGPLEIATDDIRNPKLQESITTKADGTATIYGLSVTDFENGQENTDPSKYCLVEITAPDTYSLLPEPQEVELTKGNTHDNDKGDINLVTTVVNLKETSGTLPLTGGMGIGLLAALGALIVVLGGYAAKRSGKSA